MAAATDLSYHVELLYHDDARGGAVASARLEIKDGTRWAAVRDWAAATSGYAAASFNLESEDGDAIAFAEPPLAWIRRDQQRRPFRRVILKRADVAADATFARRDVVAAAHVGLVANTINAGVSTTTLLSESIENSIQHNASRVKIYIHEADRRVVIFDDGDGIRPENVEAMAKPGASTVRDDAISAAVRGNLVAGRLDESSAGFGRLAAAWGRYGVGRFAQLNGTECRVKFVSVARDVKKVVVFEQDMARMLHQTEVVYDAVIHDHGTLEGARALHGVNQHMREAGEDGVGDRPFTCLTIEKVDAAFFADWRANREDHLALLAEKYVLHTVGPAGQQTREWLRATGLLPPDAGIPPSPEDDDPAARPKLCAIKVDGQDLGDSGKVVGSGAVANRVADLASLAEARDDAEGKRRLVRWSLAESGRGTARSLAGAAAEMAALAVYFPDQGGEATLPECMRQNQTVVFWNGLFLRDERLVPWWAAPPRDGRGRVGPLDEKLTRRCVTVLYLESTRLFAPEIHKRHLRDGDPAYQRIAEAPPAGDDMTPALKNEHRAALKRWNRDFDEEELYPHADDAHAAYNNFGASGIRRRCGKLIYRSEDYGAGDCVRFSLKGDGRRATAKVEKGVGRLLAFYASATEDDDVPGFFVAASPLLPADEGEDRAFLESIRADGPRLEALLKAGPARWWRDCYVACPSARLVDKVEDLGDAAALARKRFPAKVQPLACGEHKVPPRERDLAAGAGPFDDFNNTVYSHTPVPDFKFGLLADAAKSKQLGAADCEGLELELVARRPRHAAWDEAAVVATSGCGDDGVFALAYEETLDEVGVWQFRARLRATPGAVWTALAARAAGEAPLGLDELCRRGGDVAEAGAAPFSRALAAKLNPSEPVEVRLGAAPGRGDVALGEAFSVELAFHDSLGEQPADEQLEVDVASYDLRGGASRAWLEITGYGATALDLGGCRFAPRGGGRLALEGLVVAAEDVPADVTLPADGAVHLQLQPVVEGDYEFLTYEPVAVDAGGPGDYWFRARVGGRDGTFESLKALEAAAEARGASWLVPRTVGFPLDVCLTARPDSLQLKNPDVFADLAPPSALVECEFELMAEGGHPITDLKGMAIAVDVVDGQDEAGVEVKLMKTVVNEAGVILQKVSVVGPLGWAGRVRFAVGADERIACEAPVNFCDRSTRCSVLTLPGDDETGCPEPTHAGWVVCAEAADGRVALGSFDLNEVFRTYLRVEVVGQDGAVDADFAAASTAQLTLAHDEGARTKTGSPAPFERGAAVLSFEQLATKRSKKYKEMRRASCFTLEVELKNAGTRDVVMTSPTLRLHLAAGAPATVSVDVDALYAALDEAGAAPGLALGVAAPALALTVADETGTRVPPDQLAGLTATLVCADPHAVVEAAPVAVALGAAAGDALPGGWSVGRAFEGDDEAVPALPAEGERQRGRPIAFRVELGGLAEGADVAADFELEFRNGPCAEVRAKAINGGCMPCMNKGSFDFDEEPSPWKLVDKWGNPFEVDPYAPAAADRTAPRLFDVAIECDAADLVVCLAAAGGAKKKRKKGKAAPAPPAAAPARQIEVDNITNRLSEVNFRSLVVQLADGGPIDRPLRAKLALVVRPDGPLAGHEPERIDKMPLEISPSPSAVRVDVYERAETGRGEAWPAEVVEGARGAPVAAGGVVDVPTGTSILDRLCFQAFDETGRPVESAGDARDECKVYVGDRETLKKGDWKPVATLGESHNAKWFAAMRPEDTTTVRLKPTSSPSEVFEFQVRRVAGEPERLELRPADPPDDAMDAGDDTDDGRSPIKPRRRFQVWAYDAAGADAFSCACAAGLTVSGATFFDEPGSVSQPTGLTRIEVATWRAGADEAAAVVHDATRGNVVVPLAVAADEATLIEVRLVDATGNASPVDEQAEVQLKVSITNLEDDVDQTANIGKKVLLEVRNALGRAAAREDDARTDEAMKAKRKERSRLQLAVRDQEADVKRLEADQKQRRKARERRDKARAKREQKARELEATVERRERLERELETLDDAAESAPRRAMALSSDKRADKRLERFRAELVRALADEELPAEDLRGFLSELATVEDDSDAACLAHLCAKNKLYLESSRAVRVAKRVAGEVSVANLQVVDLSLAKPGPAWKSGTPATLRGKMHDCDVQAGAVLAALRLDCSPDDRRAVFYGLLSSHKALIFPDDASLEAADTARGSADVLRVARDAPGQVYKPGGATNIGTSTNKPPPFVFASPRGGGGAERESVDQELREARSDEDRLRAAVEAAGDGDDGADANDDDALDEIATAREELERLKGELRQVAEQLKEMGAHQSQSQAAPRAAAKRGMAALAAQKQKKARSSAEGTGGGAKKKPAKKRGRASAGGSVAGRSVATNGPNGPPTAGGDSDESDEENQPAAKVAALEGDWFEDE